VGKTERELDSLRLELTRVRESLAEFRELLDHIQRTYGLDRYRFPREVQLFGRPIPLERKDLWERMDREFMITIHDTPQVLLWLKRANRYFPFIEHRLKSNGLPDDLKYVAIVESALRPRARSRAGAVGLWQFMPATGQKYLLRRTPWVDERLDPVRSTHAALNYLTELHTLFHDWLLAVAAYNVGEEKVFKGLGRQGVATYYDLVLPAETERYIFRIASAKVILSDPVQYGFELTPEELYEPIEAQSVEAVVERGNLDLVALASVCEMTYREFLRNNPHFRSITVPRGRYMVYIPADKREDVLKFIMSGNGGVPADEKPMAEREGERIVHTVEPGETLSDIAKKYSVYLKSIKEWNHISNPNHINAGQRLIIYR
jgi:hypothetical protein